MHVNDEEFIPKEYHRLFIRTDRLLQKRGDARNYRQIAVARRWVEQHIDREAAKLGKGVVRTMSKYEMVHESSMRAMEIVIWLQYAFCDGTPGEATLIPYPNPSVRVH